MKAKFQEEELIRQLGGYSWYKSILRQDMHTNKKEHILSNNPDSKYSIYQFRQIKASEITEIDQTRKDKPCIVRFGKWTCGGDLLGERPDLGGGGVHPLT